MDFRAYLEKMKNNEVAVTSKHKLRDEARQEGFKGVRFRPYKKVKNTNVKFLILQELATPIDLFTGEKSETVNAENKFRSYGTITGTLVPLKQYWNENKDVYAKVVEFFGGEFDLEVLDKVTKKDLALIKKFRARKTYTFDVINIKSEIMHNNDYSQPYRVNFERDEYGAIVGDYPTVLQIANLYTSSLLEDFNEWKDTEGVGATKEVVSNKKMQVMSELPVSSERVLNMVMALAVPLNDSLEIDEKFIKELDASNILKYVHRIDLKGSFKESYETMPTKYSARDILPDFIEMDMLVPDEDEPMKRGLNTKYNPAENKIAELEVDGVNALDKIIDCMTEALYNVKDIEATMTLSSNTRVFNEEVQDRLFEVLDREFPFEKLNLGKKVIDRNASLITDIYGDKATDLITDVALGDGKEDTVDDKDVVQTTKDVSEFLEVAEMEEVDLED